MDKLAILSSWDELGFRAYKATAPDIILMLLVVLLVDQF